MANRQKQMVKLQKAELIRRKKRYVPPLQKTLYADKADSYKTWRDMKHWI